MPLASQTVSLSPGRSTKKRGARGGVLPAAKLTSNCRCHSMWRCHRAVHVAVVFSLPRIPPLRICRSTHTGHRGRRVCEGVDFGNQTKFKFNTQRTVLLFFHGSWKKTEEPDVTHQPNRGRDKKGPDKERNAGLALFLGVGLLGSGLEVIDAGGRRSRP